MNAVELNNDLYHSGQTERNWFQRRFGLGRFPLTGIFG